MVRIYKEFEDNYYFSETLVSRDNHLVEELLEIYANTHGIRYGSDYPIAAHCKLNISKVLKSIIIKNQLADQWVNLYYFQFAFLLKINISALSEKATE
jgi:hypothetical protein